MTSSPPPQEPRGRFDHSLSFLSGLQLVWKQENSLQEEHQQVPGGGEPLRYEDGAGGQAGRGLPPHSKLYRYGNASAAVGRSLHSDGRSSPGSAPVPPLRLWLLLSDRTRRPFPRGPTGEREPAGLSDGHAGRSNRQPHGAAADARTPEAALVEARRAAASGRGRAARTPPLTSPFVPQANGNWHGGASPPAGASPHSDLSEASD